MTIVTSVKALYKQIKMEVEGRSLTVLSRCLLIIPLFNTVTFCSSKMMMLSIIWLESLKFMQISCKSFIGICLKILVNIFSLIFASFLV